MRIVQAMYVAGDLVGCSTGNCAMEVMEQASALAVLYAAVCESRMLLYLC